MLCLQGFDAFYWNAHVFESDHVLLILHYFSCSHLERSIGITWFSIKWKENLVYGMQVQQNTFEHGLGGENWRSYHTTSHLV